MSAKQHCTIAGMFALVFLPTFAASAQTFTTLYAFLQGGTDQGIPDGGVIFHDNQLYGANGNLK